MQIINKEKRRFIHVRIKLHIYQQFKKLRVGVVFDILTLFQQTYKVVSTSVQCPPHFHLKY